MRRSLLLILCCAPVAVSCVTNDPAPLYADINYQVRCIDCEPRAVDDSAHHIAALNGENGFDVSCTVQQSGGRLVSFNAALIDAKHPTSSYGFEILQANVDKKDPGAGCRVLVTEGSNTYEGRCTSGDPTTGAPCQVIIKDDKGVATGSVLCDAIPNRNDSTVTRHVVLPGSTDAAKFAIHGCPGL
ncbi:MAG: hypothetical protein ACHQ53_14715 [Polyangiales bacterium]